MRNYQLKESRMPHFTYMIVENLLKDYKRLDMTDKGKEWRYAAKTALDIIPNEYQRGVWEKAINNVPFPLDASEITYSRYLGKFKKEVAKRLDLI